MTECVDVRHPTRQSPASTQIIVKTATLSGRTPGAWAIFRTKGAYPDELQSTWTATATDWFPSHPWCLRPGPSIVAVFDRSPEFRTATCELWLPVERE